MVRLSLCVFHSATQLNVFLTLQITPRPKELITHFFGEAFLQLWWLGELNRARHMPLLAQTTLYASLSLGTLQGSL